MNKFEDLFAVVFAGLLAAAAAFIVGFCMMAAIDASIEDPRNISYSFAVCLTVVAGLAPVYVIFVESIKYNLEKIW